RRIAASPAAVNRSSLPFVVLNVNAFPFWSTEISSPLARCGMASLLGFSTDVDVVVDAFAAQAVVVGTNAAPISDNVATLVANRLVALFMVRPPSHLPPLSRHDESPMKRA